MAEKLIPCKPFAWQKGEERATRTSQSAGTARLIHRFSGGHKRPVLCVAFARGHLITCSADGTAQVFLRSDYSLVRTYSEHSSDIMSCQLMEDADGVTVVDTRDSILTASKDCSVKIWNFVTGETLRTFTHAKPVRSAVCSKDIVVSHSGRSNLYFWSLKDGTLLFQENNLFAMASSLAVNLPMIAFGTFGKMWYLCEVSQGDVEEVIVRKISGHERAVLSVAFDRKGERALTGGEDRQAILYYLADGGSILFRLTGHIEAVLDACFSSTRDDMGMTTSLDKTARIWDLTNGTCTMVLECTDSARAGVLKGGFALIGCADNTTVLYDVSEGGYRKMLLLCRGAQTKGSALHSVPIEVLKTIKQFLI